MTSLEYQNYNKWLTTPYTEKNSLSVIVTTYHTVDYTKQILESLKENILKMPKISVEVLIYEDHRENDLLQKYVESIELKNWYYFAIPEDKSTNNSVYGRAEGIKKATGNYITFLDGDDLLTDKIWQCYTKGIELLERNKNTVISKFNVGRVKNDSRENINNLQCAININSDQIDKNFTIGINDYHTSKAPFWIWNTIIRGDFLKNIKIYNCLSEDRALNIQCFLKSSRINFINLIGYVHVYYYNNEHVQLYMKNTADALNRTPRYLLEVSNTKQFVKDYQTQINNQKSNSLKSIFNQMIKLSNDICVMSLGSNCTDIYAINDNIRRRGPLDNLHSKRGLATIDNVFNHKLKEKLLDADYTRKELKHSTIDNDLQSGEHYCNFETEFEDYRMNHNDFEDKKVKEDLEKRITSLYDYINLVKKDKSCFFVYGLGLYDFEPKTKEFKKDQFQYGLNILKENNVLNKTIFINTKSPKGGYWNFSVQDYLKSLGLHTIEVEIYSGLVMNSNEKKQINNLAQKKISDFLESLVS